MENRTYGDLAVTVLDDNAALGQHAAATFAELVRAELSERDEIAVILATGNSQLSFITAVAERDDIEWSRITVVHMDEYIGMTEDHSASFRLWMKQNIVETVHPKVFHGVRGDHEPVEEEVERYERLLLELDPVICVMGIGENGHLAFNDPPADFHTAQLVHIVAMDEVSRRQQVGEGHFPSLAETPTHAISLSIPRAAQAGARAGADAGSTQGGGGQAGAGRRHLAGEPRIDPAHPVACAALSGQRVSRRALVRV